jgi:hypothetical protein
MLISKLSSYLFIMSNVKEAELLSLSLAYFLSFLPSSNHFIQLLPSQRFPKQPNSNHTHEVSTHSFYPEQQRFGS